MNTPLDNHIIYLRDRGDPIQSSIELCSFNIDTEDICEKTKIFAALKKDITGICKAYSQVYGGEHRRIKIMIEEMEDPKNIEIVTKVYHEMMNKLKKGK